MMLDAFCNVLVILHVIAANAAGSLSVPPEQVVARTQGPYLGQPCIKVLTVNVRDPASNCSGSVVIVER